MRVKKRRTTAKKMAQLVLVVAILLSLETASMSFMPLSSLSLSITLATQAKEKQDKEAFLPENLQQADRIQCGFFKCFFWLKHNESIGYLVTPAEDHWEKSTSWEKSWHYAECLRKTYDIENLLLEPPTNTTVTPELASVLNSNLWIAILERSEHKRYKEGSTIIIQKVKAVSTPNLLFGTTKRKLKQFTNQIGNFINENVNDKEMFGRNFAICV